MASTLSQIRFLKQANLKNEQKLFECYYHELIQHYGVDVSYFRLNTDFFTSPSGDTYSNYTYGETPTSPYSLSADLVVMLKVENESPLMKKLGFETSNNSEFYITQTDFVEAFRDIIGTLTSGYFSVPVSGEIESFSGYLSGLVTNSDLSGITSAYTVVPSGTISGEYSGTVVRSPYYVNPLLKISPAYTSRSINGTLSGTVTGSIDLSGNGNMYGTADGTLFYNVNDTVNAGPNFKIAPQVGDFIRLKDFDETINNYDEYEITEIIDHDVGYQGINNLMRRYLWKCAVVRRDPSKEIVTGSVQEETFTPNFLQENTWHEIESDKIFDYSNSIDSIDKQNSDYNAYGGYGSN